MELIPLTHPGILLKQDFLDDLGIKPGTLARAIGVDRAAVKRITEGKRDITAEMSLRLGEFFDMGPGFWFGMQNNYDMRLAKREKMDAVKAEVTRMKDLAA